MAKKPPSRKQHFLEVLSAAIDDFQRVGFDSQERIDHWLSRIEQAARESLISPQVLERQLRQTLGQVFKRTVESGFLLKHHPGISEYTLAAIKPKLRAELDRRIMASANLIRLNRKASIDRTLQRFSGWATSIPIGGTRVAHRKEIKNTVKRGIAGLPFEERRVIVDQGHKLVSAVSDIVAVDGGSIAAIWRHVMEGGGYQARIEHEHRNGKIFVIRGNWALQKGFMRLAGHQYTDEIEAPGELVFCRCWYEYLYNLRDLPEEMRTVKGNEKLLQVQQQIAGWTQHTPLISSN